MDRWRRRDQQSRMITRSTGKHTGVSLVRNKRPDVLLHPFRREVRIFQPRTDAVDILLARLEVSLWTLVNVYQASNHLVLPFSGQQLDVQFLLHIRPSRNALIAI